MSESNMSYLTFNEFGGYPVNPTPETINKVITNLEKAWDAVNRDQKVLDKIRGPNIRRYQLEGAERELLDCILSYEVFQQYNIVGPWQPH